MIDFEKHFSAQVLVCMVIPDSVDCRVVTGKKYQRLFNTRIKPLNDAFTISFDCDGSYTGCFWL